MKARCAKCDQEHDLSSLEPSHAMPDVVFALSESERKRRVRMNHSVCILRSDGAEPWICFLRILLPMPVIGRERPVNWGIWVEVESKQFDEILDLWESDERLTSGPWRGQIANQLTGNYVGSTSLSGEIRFWNLEHVPYLDLDRSAHPLAVDHHQGVSEQQALERLISLVHPKGEN